jgi:GlpG protein
MRLLTDALDAATTARLADFLSSKGIETTVRDDDEAAKTALWVMDEDRLPAAAEILRAFQAAPADAAFDAPRREVRKPADGRGQAGRQLQLARSFGGHVTTTMIVVSVVLTLLSGSESWVSVVRSLYYSEYYGRGFPEILDGQVWRLFTPIFIHGGILHLVFNMMWLYQLGGAIETLEGSRYFLIMTLVFAAIVNTSQYLVSGPNFVGMSGVVYALLGYIWMMSRYKAATHYALASGTVAFMVIWMVLCMIGIIPNVANTQHFVGFVVGTVWGFIRSGHIATLRRRARYRRGL